MNAFLYLFLKIICKKGCIDIWGGGGGGGGGWGGWGTEPENKRKN